MAKYRTKSKEVEAVKFTRDNFEEVKEFTNGKAMNFYIPHNIEGQANCELECKNKVFRVLENRYIVKDSDGNFYICSEDSFESLYEEVK